ncbi:hypothetical protein OG689_28585 [Kitasatospora sp. NBC_00240]|uniref:hypothetical protein n=1 Tax=Kitasatospora sp. NBC_00240 TaxID=2903567 RepID=UPI002258F05F|nr:hypothetical protein [Kitasatospora sp. NBC_00240]MCX5213176.1 hypothetical protein [Kitasatospora sp. NBC_00240]
MSSQVFADFSRPPTDPRKAHIMFLLALLVAMGLLAGAAVHTSMSVFLTASAAIALWLLAFGAREGLARRRAR